MIADKLEELYAKLAGAGPSPEDRKYWDFDAFPDIDLNDAARSKEWADGFARSAISGRVLRDAFVARYAWAVPSREAIEAIAAFVGSGLLLEVCAGRGLWAALLRLHGVSMIATDISPGGRSPTEAHGPDTRELELPDYCYTKVEKRGAVDSVRAHRAADALMLVWPPLMDKMADLALRSFKGSRLIYVGEWRGCTASDAFHDRIEKKWEDPDEPLWIPQWPGLHDAVYLLRRK